MKRVLHIVTHPDDPLAQTVIDQHRSDTALAVEVVDLTSGEPDYRRLLEQIFAADSVAVW